MINLHVDGSKLACIFWMEDKAIIWVNIYYPEHSEWVDSRNYYFTDSSKNIKFSDFYVHSDS